MRMKVGWTEKERAYFNKPIKKAEQTNEISWWFLFGAVIVMEAIFIVKIVGTF